MPSAPRITPLKERHHQALQRFLAAFDRHGEPRIPAYFAERAWIHREIVDTFQRWSREGNLERGWSPCFTRFAEADGELVGVYNIRELGQETLPRALSHVGFSVRPDARGHGFATFMLTDAQQFAAARGMTTLTLTCDETNPASRRVIERCGGVLTDRYPEEDGITLRFQVPTTP